MALAKEYYHPIAHLYIFDAEEIRTSEAKQCV